MTSRRMTPREQELADFPAIVLLQEAVALYSEGAVRTSWYFLLVWASIGGDK
jgi:hypothetical protein